MSAPVSPLDSSDSEVEFGAMQTPTLYASAHNTPTPTQQHEAMDASNSPTMLIARRLDMNETEQEEKENMESPVASKKEAASPSPNCNASHRSPTAGTTIAAAVVSHTSPAPKHDVSSSITSPSLMSSSPLSESDSESDDLDWSDRHREQFTEEKARFTKLAHMSLWSKDLPGMDGTMDNVDINIDPEADPLHIFIQDRTTHYAAMRQDFDSCVHKANQIAEDNAQKKLHRQVELIKASVQQQATDWANDAISKYQQKLQEQEVAFRRQQDEIVSQLNQQHEEEMEAMKQQHADEIQRATQELEDAQSKGGEEVVQKLQEAEQERVELEQRIQQLEQEKKENEAAQKSEIGTMKEQLDAVQTEHSALQQEHKNLLQQFDDLQRSNQALESSYQDQSKAWEQSENLVNDLRSQLQQAEAHLLAQSSKDADENATFERMQHEISDLRKQLDEARVDVATKQVVLERLEEQLTNVSKEREEALDSARVAQCALEPLQTELSSTKSLLISTQDTLRSTQELLASERQEHQAFEQSESARRTEILRQLDSARQDLYLEREKHAQTCLARDELREELDAAHLELLEVRQRQAQQQQQQQDEEKQAKTQRDRRLEELEETIASKTDLVESLELRVGELESELYSSSQLLQQKSQDLAAVTSELSALKDRHSELESLLAMQMEADSNDDAAMKESNERIAQLLREHGELTERNIQGENELQTATTLIENQAETIVTQGTRIGQLERAVEAVEEMLRTTLGMETDLDQANEGEDGSGSATLSMLHRHLSSLRSLHSRVNELEQVRKHYEDVMAEERVGIEEHQRREREDAERIIELQQQLQRLQKVEPTNEDDDDEVRIIRAHMGTMTSPLPSASRSTVATSPSGAIPCRTPLNNGRLSSCSCVMRNREQLEAEVQVTPSLNMKLSNSKEQRTSMSNGSRRSTRTPSRPSDGAAAEEIEEAGMENVDPSSGKVTPSSHNHFSPSGRVALREMHPEEVPTPLSQVQNKNRSSVTPPSSKRTPGSTSRRSVPLAQQLEEAASEGSTMAPPSTSSFPPTHPNNQHQQPHHRRFMMSPHQRQSARFATEKLGVNGQSSGGSDFFAKEVDLERDEDDEDDDDVSVQVLDASIVEQPAPKTIEQPPNTTLPPQVQLFTPDVSNIEVLLFSLPGTTATSGEQVYAYKLYDHFHEDEFGFIRESNLRESEAVGGVLLEEFQSRICGLCRNHAGLKLSIPTGMKLSAAVANLLHPFQSGGQFLGGSSEFFFRAFGKGRSKVWLHRACARLAGLAEDKVYTRQWTIRGAAESTKKFEGVECCQCQQQGAFLFCDDCENSFNPQCGFESICSATGKLHQWEDQDVFVSDSPHEMPDTHKVRQSLPTRTPSRGTVNPSLLNGTRSIASINRNISMTMPASMKTPMKFMLPPQSLSSPAASPTTGILRGVGVSGGADAARAMLGMSSAALALNAAALPLGRKSAAPTAPAPTPRHQALPMATPARMSAAGRTRGRMSAAPATRSTSLMMPPPQPAAAGSRTCARPRDQRQSKLDHYFVREITSNDDVHSAEKEFEMEFKPIDVVVNDSSPSSSSKSSASRSSSRNVRTVHRRKTAVSDLYEHDNDDERSQTNISQKEASTTSTTSSHDEFAGQQQQPQPQRSRSMTAGSGSLIRSLADLDDDEDDYERSANVPYRAASLPAAPPSQAQPQAQAQAQATTIAAAASKPPKPGRWLKDELCADIFPSTSRTLNNNNPSNGGAPTTLLWRSMLKFGKK